MSNLCFKQLTFIPCSTTYFQEVCVQISLKVATDAFLEIKNLKKENFWGYYSKAKTEKCDRRNLCFCDTFGMFKTCSTIYFLEMSARSLLKPGTSGPFRGKKTSKMGITDPIILSKKWRSAAIVIYVFWSILERSNLI